MNRSHRDFAIALAFFGGLLLAAESGAACTAPNSNPNLAEATPTADFTDNGDGTVTHNKTGLMWKRCQQGQTWAGATCTGSASQLTWAAALSQSVSDNFAGHTDWRLPNIKELGSIVEPCGYGPSINATLFPATATDMETWSSTSFDWDKAYAHNLNFANGFLGDGAKVGNNHARLVRAGNSADSFDLLGGGLIARYYQVILGRAATNTEINTWLSEVSRVAALGAEAKESYRVLPGIFFQSGEYLGRGTSNNQYVTDLYLALFNRSPDSGGFSYWTGQLGLGLPRDEALFGFLFAPESDSYYASVLGSGSTRAEVNMVMDFYRGMMNRLPDSGGFSYWTGLIRTAQCQGSTQVTSMVNSISSQFLQSAEYVGRSRSNADFVSDMYYTFMRRGATLNEVSYWTGQVDGAVLTRDGVRTQFLNSSEFQARVSGVIAQGCLP